MSYPTSVPPIPRVFITDESILSIYNRGPITTAFSPPASCLDTMTMYGRGTLYFGHFYGPFIDTACYPAGANTQKLTDATSWDTYYYSPAICPYGWTTATTFSAAYPGNNATTWIRLGPGTTAGVCCPSGHKYWGLGHLCTSRVTQNQLITYIVPTNNGVEILRPVSSSTQPSDSSIRGDGVPIWWQSSDMEVLRAAATMVPSSTGSITSSAQTSPTASIASSTSTPTPTEPSPTDSPSGISTGAKAGIGVGAAIAVAALAMGLYFFLMRKRRAIAAGAPVHEADAYSGYEADSGAPKEYAHLHEMSQPELQHPRYELAGAAAKAP
ncbi:hypothetical protein P280DRAFT_465689 [Massarina eburnea CBS 473.64]|uniref:Uncharacterized protein n=1 Tax=Massarina eburnea CBS 473.64 TaxID=1395130 RepID=A0A6A6SDU6_9PLEO|nr:hypothetical protein P280DRAFT_465689 [Massarina eburnea CBS 473.64]